MVRQSDQIDFEEVQLDVHRTVGALFQRHLRNVQRIDGHQIDSWIAFMKNY